MKKKLFSVLLALVLVLVLGVAMPVSARGVYRGEAEDFLSPELGVIKYLGTPAGYHFWFTSDADIGPYLAGHSYHNVYQLTVDDTSEWAGPVLVPNRAPYNSVGHTGKWVYYKIFDTTTDIQVRP